MLRVYVFCKGSSRNLGICKAKDGLLFGWNSPRFSDLMYVLSNNEKRLRPLTEWTEDKMVILAESTLV